MNKKGLLPKATLRMVIAVICIVFLVYFLVSLYYSYSSNKDLEQAEASLEHLIESIDSGYTEVEIYNPKNWGISSFPLSINFPAYEVPLPEFCSSLGWENCLCICNVNFGKLRNFDEDCDKLGICVESDLVVEGDNLNSIPILKPPIILKIEDKTITKITKKET